MPIPAGECPECGVLAYADTTRWDSQPELLGVLEEMVQLWEAGHSIAPGSPFAEAAREAIALGTGRER